MKSRLLGVAMPWRTTLTAATVLTLVFAGTAVAGTGVGAVFNLGRTNTVNAVSVLTGTVGSAVAQLRIYNKGTGPGLEIWTPAAGRAPIKLNSYSTGRVTYLNADRLDSLHASAPVAPNTIPARDAAGKLPGDITGNAATANSATNANNANLLDGIDSTVFLEGRVFRSAMGASTILLAAGNSFSYTPAFTASSNGTCLVTVSSQIYSSGANTSSGPYFRVAIKRGSVDGQDGFYGHYFGPTAANTYSQDMARSSRFAVSAGEVIQFGAFFGSVPADWVGDTADNHVTYTCHRANTAGALSSAQKGAGPANTRP